LKVQSEKIFKIFIAYNIISSPWGGGNQFLKNLKKIWINSNIYTDNVDDADAILYNSHQNLEKVIKYKFDYPEKLFIHRIDGPISKYREGNILLDKLIFFVSESIADAVVFQSEWSMNESLLLGLKSMPYFDVIHNASDSSIFFPSTNVRNKLIEKIKLISISWSDNPNKGFDIYSYLDLHLDFEKYEFTFIGNSPYIFNNIKIISPVKSKKIGKYLRDHHILIMASRFESCSNTIIEALSCGLPVLYRDGTSNGEIVKNAGVSFQNNNDVILALEKVANNYDKYCNNIKINGSDDIACQYYSLVKNVNNEILKKKYHTKKIGIIFLIKYRILRLLEKAFDKLYSIKHTLINFLK